MHKFSKAIQCKLKRGFEIQLSKLEVQCVISTNQLGKLGHFLIFMRKKIRIGQGAIWRLHTHVHTQTHTHRFNFHTVLIVYMLFEDFFFLWVML